MVRRALPNVLEGTILPVAVFYSALWALGVWGAVAAGLAWSWGAVAFRLLTHRPVPGLLMIGAAAMTARTLISVASGSVFIYFLQPTIGTVALAVAFLLSVPAGRPLASKLAADFLPMPDWFVGHPAISRFFVRVTLLWGGVQLATAGIALWLLVSQPVTVYLAAKTVATVVVMGAAIAGSVAWFRSVLRHSGLSLASP
jgi:hypothetical protein